MKWEWKSIWSELNLRINGNRKKLHACRIFLTMDNSNNNVIGCLYKLNNNVKWMFSVVMRSNVVCIETAHTRTFQWDCNDERKTNLQMRGKGIFREKDEKVHELIQFQHWNQIQKTMQFTINVNKISMRI